MKYIHKHETELFNHRKQIRDINLKVEQQLELYQTLSKQSIIPWRENENDEYRYYYRNNWYKKGSADTLCRIMQYTRPNRIIEVGSGFSTAVMLDTNTAFFDNAIQIMSVEPRPQR